MNRNIVFINIMLAIFSVSKSNGQEKYDNIWVSGLWGNQPNLFFGGSQVEFSSSSPILSYFDMPFQIDANASICDVNGNLLFYTNGCEIASYNHSIMDNGEALNPGYGLEFFCKKNDLGYSKGYRAHQGIIIVPQPSNANLFNIYHLNFKNDAQYQIELLETIVDMSLNNGLGKVVAKNILVKQDTFSDNLSAIRHGNGRDWWIVVPKQSSNKYYLFLLTPTGISETNLVACGTTFSQHPYGGQATFSMDGNWYARIRPSDGLEIMNFDRCNGSFSFPIYMDLGDSLFAAGCTFSPNSRFLYISSIFVSTSYIYQYDLESANISLSKQLVAQWDGVLDPFSTNFYQQTLAPNQKIYISTGNGSRYFHIIHEPNVMGASCMVEQRGLTLPTYRSFPMPNFPQFRAYNLEGSLCDSLVSNITLEPIKNTGLEFTLFPNPTYGFVNIELSAQSIQGNIVEVELIDLYGKKVFYKEISAISKRINLSFDNISKGVFFIKITLDNGISSIKKMIIN